MLTRRAAAVFSPRKFDLSLSLSLSETPAPYRAMTLPVIWLSWGVASGLAMLAQYGFDIGLVRGAKQGYSHEAGTYLLLLLLLQYSYTTLIYLSYT